MLHFSTSDYYFINEKEELTIDTLKKAQPKFIFFPHWSYIIPSEIFENFNCIVFHMTDLPFGRGGSPLQNLISRGIHETKISAIKVVKELDAGPVYLKKDLSLYGTAEEIYLRAGDIIIRMIEEII
ncbi:MAG: formyltransferase family protein, partial [Bacteroidota bacterium]